MMRRVLAGIFAVCAVFALSGLHAADIVISDFEGTGYSGWTVEGEAFGKRPARGTIGDQQHVSGFKGKGLVNTFIHGDAPQGTLTSPEFRIERKYITFLIGGGNHKNTCLQLLVDGNVVASRSGENAEELTPAMFDVRAHNGKAAQLRIVDGASGSWGHVNVDHIVMTDSKPQTPDLGRHEKTFTVDTRYLIMPIRNGGRKKGGRGQIQLFIDGTEVRRYGINLAPSAAATDWYAFFTIESYKGKQARVVASKVTEAGFALVKGSNTIPGEEDFYKEPYRPQFHFTQRVGWNNDPNGMVYHGGRWHLFFQHNPVALPWGNMTWGHATSPDLLHWEQQPNKLFPNITTRGACFSGGGTVDKLNTSGWGKNALVVYLTDTGAGESVAYSIDNGKSFTFYKNNPVVKHKGRDPKVTWYTYGADDVPLNDTAKQLGGHWVMVVFDDKKPYGRNAAFYTSTNMKNWTEQSHLPGYFECTELFELPVDDDPGNTRWVVFAADARYAVGQFDGRVFKPEHEGKHRVHYGPYYASQTFDNAPDGRKIQIGWVRVTAPGPYNQHFSFPHRLTLHTTKDGIRMFAKPVKEVERLRAKSNMVKAQDLAADSPVKLAVGSDLLDIRTTVEVGNARQIVLNLPGREVKYDVGGGKLNGAPLRPVDGRISVQVLADRSLTEIAGNDGRVFISAKGPSKMDVSEISIVAKGGDAKLIRFEAHELKSIWNK